MILIEIESLISKSSLGDQEKQELIDAIKQVPAEYLQETYGTFYENPENIVEYYNDYKAMKAAADENNPAKLQKLVDLKIAQLSI